MAIVTVASNLPLHYHHLPLLPFTGPGLRRRPSSTATSGRRRLRGHSDVSGHMYTYIHNIYIYNDNNTDNNDNNDNDYNDNDDNDNTNTNTNTNTADDDDDDDYDD